jgi:hypothetical protein
MHRLIVITIVVLVLYAVFRIGGKWLLPRWQQHRLEKYKEKYFQEHSHLSAEKYREMKKKQEEESAIIDHRKRLR